MQELSHYVTTYVQQFQNHCKGDINSGAVGGAFKIQTRYYKSCRHLTMWPQGACHIKRWQGAGIFADEQEPRLTLNHVRLALKKETGSHSIAAVVLSQNIKLFHFVKR